MHLKTRHGHRARLLIAFGASWIILAALVAYAFSLEAWGETRTIAFTLIGFTCVGVGLSAMVLFLIDLARSRRPEPSVGLGPSTSQHAPGSDLLDRAWRRP